VGKKAKNLEQRKMTPFFAQIFRLALPYMLAATAGLLSERAGVINFALEGVMLFSALAGAAVAIVFHSMWLGVAASALAGVTVSLAYYAFTATRRTDQVLLGIAFNLSAIGLTRFILKLGFGSASNSPRIPSDAYVFWPALALMALAFVLLRHTSFGLRLIAAGDAPDALTAAHISLTRVRATALALSGVFSGLAGGSLVAAQHQFTDNMSAGRGYIAVAAVVFGGWRMGPVLLVCLLFAVAEATDFWLQGRALFAPQLAQMLPYLVCLVALTLRRKTYRAPFELGR
jgi:simple sugar transport system permease protein